MKKEELELELFACREALDRANTANIMPGRYVFDTIISDESQNTTTRILEGIVEVTPRVTRF